MFELFCHVHPTPKRGPLAQVSWWEGWNAFRGTPSDIRSLGQSSRVEPSLEGTPLLSPIF